MKRTFLFHINILFITFELFAQDYNVTIDGQIIGYDGQSSVSYVLAENNSSNNFEFVYPDSLGRFTILKHIKKTNFFRLAYSNKKESTEYQVKLIVQPNNDYSIVGHTKKRNRYEWKTPFNTDIYNLKRQNESTNTILKMDYGQLYYNEIIKDAHGGLFRDEWNLQQPDSLIETLNQRIYKQVILFENLLKESAIDEEFFQIAKTNIEYQQVYELAQTIQDIWMLPNRFGIQDTVIEKKIVAVYDSLFQIFPIEKVNLDVICNAPNRYVNAYLYYLSSFKSGSFSPPKKGTNWYNIESIRPILSEEVYKNIKLQETMSRVGGLELSSSGMAKNLMEAYPDLAQTKFGQFLENELIPRSEMFDSLAERPLSKEVIILDDQNTITSFQQLCDSIGHKPFLIDLWGTWCGPCRQQFQFNDSLKAFLKKNNIEMVYGAKEYQPNREIWKKLISAYDLTGYHFMVTNEFIADMEKRCGKLSGFPTYMIIDSTGKVVEPQAHFPSEGIRLLLQLKDKLSLK